MISTTDYHFARLIQRLSGGEDNELGMGAALVSRATAEKHVCLDLAVQADQVLLPADADAAPVACPDLDRWVQVLTKSHLVGTPGAYKPLVLDSKNRLYLYRYWQYEKTLAASLLKRAEGVMPVDVKKLKSSLDRLFPQTASLATDMQQMAALVCAFKKICIITGGPGTGKTTTVAKLLAVLLEQAENAALVIKMAAPTGKAAMRLNQAIMSVKKRLNVPEHIRDAIPETAMTLHRLLKPISDGPYFRHNRENPVDADVVVVDEASMVDVALMAKLIDAVSNDTRLVLMGDSDQLASVEAGSVLGDICRDNVAQTGSKLWPNLLNHLDQPIMADNIITHATPSAVADCVVRLSHSYRFARNRSMERLVLSVRSNDFHGACQSMESLDPMTPVLGGHLAMSYHEILSKAVMEGYGPYLRARTAAEGLVLFERFKILCAVNKGPYGVSGVNQIAESILAQERLIVPASPWYAGQPVLVTRNDYSLGLFNGDTGLVWPASDAPGASLYVHFTGRDGELRKIPPHRLPAWETAYAMTVHRTQGSEFDTIFMVLPERDNPLMTRELLYTGITRARKTLRLWATPDSFKTAMSRRIHRQSGLPDYFSNNIFK